MDLSFRLTFLITATLIFTLTSLVIFLLRKKLGWFHQFNEAFLGLFGIQTEHPSEVRSTINWLLTTCLATVNYTLIVNIIDAAFLLAGTSGIPLDPWVVSLAVSGIIGSVILLSVTLLPALTMPAAWPTALGIVGFLHLYGVYYEGTLPGLLSTFLYFVASAIGFVAGFLALYLFLRSFIWPGILRRFKRDSNNSGTMEASASAS